MGNVPGLNFLKSYYRKDFHKSNEGNCIHSSHGFYFYKLLLKIVYKNIKNIILILFKNCYYYLDLVFFYVFLVFYIKKTKNQMSFLCFTCFSK